MYWIKIDGKEGIGYAYASTPSGKATMFGVAWKDGGVSNITVAEITHYKKLNNE